MDRKKLKQQAKTYLDWANSIKLFLCMVIVEFIRKSPMRVIEDHINLNINSINDLYLIRDQILTILLRIPHNIYITVSTLGLISLVLGPVFKMSLSKICLDFLKDGKVKISNLFTCITNFDWVLQSFILNILIKLYTVLWTLLFIIPGIVKFYSYSMAFYIMADNPGIGASEALNRSKFMMNGHKFDLFVLQISFFWWHVLSVITFGLYYVYTYPYIQTTMAAFYQELKSKQEIISVTSN